MRSNSKWVLAVAIAAACTGCATPERSRALGDPTTKPTATAQQICSNCHGLDGNSVSPNFPRLAGQTEEYIVTQLTAFRNQHRIDPAGFEYMWGLSRHLTDEQIKGLAAYFSAQVPSMNQPVEPEKAARGKDVFENGIADQGVPACATCHGAKALGAGMFPRLAGQHSAYLVRQLVVFQKTEARPDATIMKSVSHSLTPDNMESVALYLQGMTPN
jgi:cytochrome c553